MRFWIDECLTPALVGRAHLHGYEATCTRDRGTLGMQDDELLTLAVGEEFVFATNNHADFTGLCANAELHTGLVVLPQRPRDAQLPLLSDAIAHIERHAAQAGEAPADWMLNRVVEIDDETEICGDNCSPTAEPQRSTGYPDRVSRPAEPAAQGDSHRDKTPGLRPKQALRPGCLGLLLRG